MGWPRHLRVTAGWGLLLIALVTAWAIAFPPPLGRPPVAGIEVTKPPYLFWWLYAAEDFIGIRGLLILPAIFFLLLAAVPFVDRGRSRAMRRRRGTLVAGLVVLAILAGLSAYTGLTRPVAHTQMGQMKPTK